MRHHNVPRAALLLLSLTILVAALACLPAAAQETPAASSAAAAAAQTTVAPYQPAAAAFAAPRPAAAAASSDGPDPDRKWEIEIHGGGLLATSPASGNVALPDPGAPFTTFVGDPSRFVSSWYFGDGATLYNQFVADTAIGLTNTITPLDPMINSEVVHRQHGAAFGGRLYRELTPRWGVELNFDYNLGELEISSRGLSQLAATSASWQAAFGELSALFAGTAVSSFTVHRSDGHQALITGGAVLNLKTEGRTIPYLTFGLGVIHNTGDMPFANLVGNYQFFVFNETDTVGLRYTINENVVTGYVGIGVKHYFTPHWGIRIDARDYLSPNTINNLVDATPTGVRVTVGGTALTFPTGGLPTLQFSNNLSFQPTNLSGPVITGFRTFSSNGAQQQIAVSGGVFFRF